MIQVPYGIIEKINISAKCKVEIYCKVLTNILLSFEASSQAKDIKSQVESMMANYNYRAVFAFQYKEIFTSPFDSIYSNVWNIYNIEREFERQGVSNTSNWRITKTNTNYQLCSSYPKLLCVPNHISDGELACASDFRTKGRIPVLTYMYKNGHTICRASQPKVGLKLMNRRCVEDELLVNAIKLSSPNTSTLMVYDARPKVNAIANQAKGAGYEDVYNAYVDCEVRFLNIDNMHAVRNSYNLLRDLCSTHFSYRKSNNNLSTTISLSSQQYAEATKSPSAPPSVNPSRLLLDDKVRSKMTNVWFTYLMNTRWLDHLHMILRGALKIAKAIYLKDTSVLVHCSNGWFAFPFIYKYVLFMILLFVLRCHLY